jgi:hypothetical protein
MNRTSGAAFIVVGRLTGALVASWTSDPTYHRSCGCGGSSQRLAIAIGLVVVVVVVVATALSSGALIGIAALAYLRGRWVCQARPSAALVHLSTRLNSSVTSWMSCMVSFSSIFSSLTPW